MTQFQCFQIASAIDFQSRVRFLMSKTAVAKLEAPTPPAPDQILGQHILDGAEPVFPWALAATADPVIANGAHSLDGSTVLDAQLETIITGLWQPFSQ